MGNPRTGNPTVLRFAYLLHSFQVIHQIGIQISLTKFSRIREEIDFVELSSQLLENLCHECVMMSRLYKDMHKPDPTEVCRTLKMKIKSSSRLKTKQKIVLCPFDQIIHTNEVWNIKELLQNLYPKGEYLWE
jgi:Zn-dependent oligopeptidase